MAATYRAVAVTVEDNRLHQSTGNYKPFVTIYSFYYFCDVA